MATVTTCQAEPGRSHLALARLASLLWGLLAWGPPMAIYLRTMAPTVYGLDSAELTTGAYVLGIVHAPGSPLYLLLGHLFTGLPVGDVGYRLNLLSGCAAALALLFMYRILLHLTQHRLLSLLTTWVVAFSYYFWVSALFAELYALHTCLMTGLLWLTLIWRKQGRPWQLYLLALGFGLSLGNHLSMVLLGPGFAWLVLSKPARPRPYQLLIAAGCGLLGAAIYLYLPLRHLAQPPMNYAYDYCRPPGYCHVNLATWSGFWWMVTGGMFDSLFFNVPLAQLPAELGHYIYQLWSNFVGLGFIIGAVGLVSTLKRREATAGGLLLMFGSHLLFYLTYGAADKELMFLPTFIIWGLWLGLGAAYLARQIERRLPDTYHLLLPTLLVMLVLSTLVLNFNYVDLSRDWSARQLGQDIITEMEQEALFIGTWQDVPILEYLQLVEAQRPDVELVNVFFIDRGVIRRKIYEQLRAGLPVYTSVETSFDPRFFQLDYVEACNCYHITDK